MHTASKNILLLLTSAFMYIHINNVSAKTKTKTKKLTIDVFAKKVASAVSVNITKKAKQITNYHRIKGDFEAVQYDQKLTRTKKLVGRDVIKAFKADIEAIFEDKVQALKRIKKSAEAARMEHGEDREDIEEFDYLNMRNVERNDEISLKIHPPFSPEVAVNVTHSFVQIPTNIYEYTPQILNTVAWTQKLDDTFKDNYFNVSSESLLYQYYGDKSGLMRLYPGNKIGVQGEPGNIDLFDCRRRVWYIQSSASPKDVVIIIDMSGSMKGSNKGIARIAAASLIETLSENDYFNVITVNDKVSYVEPCAKRLIQATKINKEFMKAKIQKLGKPRLQINSELAIEEAFKILNSGAENNRTANCNKAIMLISDGVEGENVAPRIFEKYNANRTVRAFAFFIGRAHVNVGKKALVRMACDNRGFFYPVETVGDIWETVLKYIQVMSRPMNESRGSMGVSYTPMYPDVGGLGMVMSVSLGVFDKEGLIGVTGTDITLQSMLEKVPVWNFGAFTHVFMVNNNGFVVMHPKLKPQSGYMVAPRNVFLEDVLKGAVGNISKQLKESMVDRTVNGVIKFPMYWQYDNDQKVSLVNNSYVYFEPIDGTDFSAGVLLVDNEVARLEYDDEAADNYFIDGVKALDVPPDNEASGKFHNVEIARWEYCEKPYDKTTPKSIKSYYTAAELKKHLNKSGRVRELPDNCKRKRELLKRLLVTAAIVNKGIKKSWSSEEIESDLYDGVFVSTTAGYAKYYSKNRTIRRSPGFVKPPHLDMAAANPSATISISAPYRKRDDSKPLYFTLTAAVKVGDDDILTAVSGVRIKSDYFQMVLEEAVRQPEKNFCAEHQTHICALIDTNGFIMASNQGDHYTGRFVGEISGILMEALASDSVGIFKKIIIEDTQAECDQPKEEASDSRLLLSPFTVLSQSASALVQSVAYYAYAYLAFFSLTTDAVKKKQRPREERVKISCTIRKPFYVFQADRFQEMAGDEHKEADCEIDSGCFQIYYINPVKETNLLFLNAKTTTQCRRACFHSHANLTEKRDTDNSVCKMGQRYRRPPRSCFNQPIEAESVDACGKAGIMTSTVLLTMVLPVLALLWG